MWQKRINIAVILLTSLLVVGVVFPFVQRLREAARNTQSKNNLKQIGLALHNYADTYQGFPPGGVFNLEGRGFHGWMTSILPYMEDSPFYNYVNFEEPWDSTRNAGLFLNAMPCYENPGEPKVRRHWEFPVAHYSANSNLMAVNSYVNLTSIKNKQQTFLVRELDGEFLPWGCPYNWRELERLNSKPPKYGRFTSDGCHFLFVDGSVKFVANDVSSDILKSMNSDDLSGLKEDSLNIQRPSVFPCPSDALWITWSWHGEDLVKVDRDIHGNVKSQERHRGK